MHPYNYMWRDARDGIRRNRGASLAAAALIFTAMAIAGVLMLVRSGTHEALLYLQSQVSMKAYVDPAADTNEVARILRRNGFVREAVIESGAQQLAKLSPFFKGREQLLASFSAADMPDAVRLELKPGTDALLFAGELRTMRGIADVVYPQQFAETVLDVSAAVNRYGLALFLFFAAVSFLTVYMAISLALAQRSKEIRVKLLLGAKPAHVRGQFLLEGGLIGLLGSLCAAFAVYILQAAVLERLALHVPFLTRVSIGSMYGLMAGIVSAGMAIGVAASYVSTGRLMDDA